MFALVRPVAPLAVGASLLLATSIAAQSPDAFRAIPADSEALVRVNFGSMDDSPRFGPIMAQFRAQEPGFPTSMLEQDDMFADGFPGEIRIIEIGLKDLQGDPPPLYLALYGLFDVEAMTEVLAAEGIDSTSTIGDHTVYAKGGDDPVAVMMPNDYTLLLANDIAGLGQMHGAATGEAPGARSQGAPLATMTGSAQGAHAFAAFRLGSEQRAEMRQAIQQMQQSEQAMMLMMFPGLMQFMNELGELQSVAVSLDENSEGARFNLGLNFTGEENAERASTYINQTIPAAAGMMAGFAQGDPEALAQLQAFGALRFGHSGSRAFLSMPISQEMLDQAAEAVGELGSLDNLQHMFPQGGMGQQPVW